MKLCDKVLSLVEKEDLKGWALIIADLKAGGGKTLDLYYNKKRKLFMEIKNGKEIFVEEDDMDPAVYHIPDSKFWALVDKSKPR